MALPERLRVKLISDSAGYIEMARVVERDFAFEELLTIVVGVAGLDAARIQAILRAGTVVAGAYRYRWAPVEVTAKAELAGRLERFPKPEPTRPFDAGRCEHARIRAGVETIELSRPPVARRPRWGVPAKQPSFWDVLMELARARIPRYETFSHREGADVYWFEPTADDEAALRRAAPLLRIARLEEQLTGLPLEKVTLYVNR